MNETKVDWTDLQLFLAVAHGGGLAGGANLSGVSAPTLGRHMLRLERALGQVLFNRLPRGYDLTVKGRHLLKEAQEVETGILRIERRSASADAAMPVTVSAGTWMTWFLTTHIRDIAIKSAKLTFSNAENQQSIARREATIGLRNARPTEPGLAGRKSARINFAAYARADVLHVDQWLTSTANAPSANWVRANKGHLVRHEVTNPRSLLDLARQGAGHVVLPCFVGDQDTEIMRAGPIIKDLGHDQWLVVHSEDRSMTPVRNTVDLVAKLLKSHRAAFEGKRQTA